MHLKLPSRFIGTFTAMAIAATTFSAAPAVADDERNARAIAALLGIAVIGKIIHDNKNSHAPVAGPIYQVNPNSTAPVYKKPRVRTQPHPHPQPLPRRVNRKLLPEKCLRSFQTRNGHVRMFPRRCLERNYDFVNRLPLNCGVRVNTDRGPRQGYGARCLRRSGYSLARG
jgi:hypothetical protein